MKKHSIRAGIAALLIALLASGCFNNEESADRELESLLSRMTLEEKIAQKFVVDFRYFCDPPVSNCSTRWTQMQPDIRSFLQQQALGGVILFSNNIQSVAQTVQLTHDIQAASFAGRLGIGSLITTDQEGGNVLRTPRDSSTRFTGNMSIGATWSENATRYASAVGTVLGSELAALGINVNHAPVLDVNINPNNPVINVRSFSDSPEMVAKLGLSLQTAIQSQGVASTVKHFPGHGDTQVDSHYGLPLVNHDLATVKNIDLFPFQYAFDRSPPDMVMTAHIQYPALDSSTLAASQPKYSGQSMLRPATLSRRILTNLLRDDMRYEGVVITDAMTMDGIAAFFTPEDAAEKTFAAGADIALMPFSLSSTAKIQEFDRLIQSVVQAVRSGTLSEAEINTSVLRILKLKKKLGLLQASSIPVEAKIEAAQRMVGSAAHLEMERELAENAVTLLKNNNGAAPVLPLNAKALNRVTILAAKDFQGLALKNSVQLAAANQGNNALTVTVFNINTLDPVEVNKELAQSNLLLIANDANKVTPAETDSLSLLKVAKKADAPTFDTIMSILSKSGSLVFDEEANSPNSRLKASVVSRTDQEKVKVMIGALQTAKSLSIPSVFISLAAPYETAVFTPYSDSILAVYNGNSYINPQGIEVGVAYQAVSRILLGDVSPKGHLPINIPSVDGQTVLYPRGHGLTLSAGKGG